MVIASVISTSIKLNSYSKLLSLLLELDKKVFGKITTKEIIGAAPPAFPDTRDILEKELESLLAQLASLSKEDLERLLEQQQIAQMHINSRPGAMALAQTKIRLFNDYSQKYLQSIEQKLETLS